MTRHAGVRMPCARRACNPYLPTQRTLDRQRAAMIGKLNHLAVVVPDLIVASGVYRQMLGASVSEPQALPAHGVTVVFVELANTRIELLEPLGANSPVPGCSVTASRGSAPMTSRCCSCTRRISAAP